MSEPSHERMADLAPKDEEKKEDPYNDGVSYQTSIDDRSVDTSVMEAKVQILYSQMEEQAKIIKQLKAENSHLKEEAEIMEKECSDCMQELSDEVEELKDVICERDEMIESFKNRGMRIEKNSQEDLLVELENFQRQIEEKDGRIQELEDCQGVNAELLMEATQCAALRAQVEYLQFQRQDNCHEQLKMREKEMEILKAKISELEESLQTSKDLAAERDIQCKEAHNQSGSLTSLLNQSKMEAETLKEKDEMNRLLLKQREEDIEILYEKLEDRDVKIKEKDRELIALSEKDQVNNSLLKQREEDVEILYEQIGERDKKIGDLEEKVKLNESALELLQEREAAFIEVATEKEELVEQSSRQSDEIEKLWEEYDRYQGETTKTIAEMNLRAEKQCLRIEDLERENALNDELIKELRGLHRFGEEGESLKEPKDSEKKNDNKNSSETKKQELEQRFKETNLECQQLRVKVELLSDELNKIQEEKVELDQKAQLQKTELWKRIKDNESDKQELQEKVETLSCELNLLLQEEAERVEGIEQAKEVASLLEAEQSRCEQLSSQIESLTRDLMERAGKVASLGFDSDDGLVAAYIETKDRLHKTEDLVERLNHQHQLNGNKKEYLEGTALTSTEYAGEQKTFLCDTLTDVSECNYKDETGEGACSSNFTDDVCTTALLEKERSLSDKLLAKVQSVTLNIKDWELRSSKGDHQTDKIIEENVSFCAHLSNEIECLSTDLRSRDTVNEGIIQIFQAKLQDRTDESSEPRKGPRLSKTSQDCPVEENYILGCKIKKLLCEIEERDEKVKTLEWLTMDLSTALDNKTGESLSLQEQVRKEREAKDALNGKVDLLLKDAEGRESRIENLKKKIVELEEAVSHGESQREGFQTLIDSLTEDLKEQEQTIKTLNEDLDKKKKFIKMRENQLEQELEEKGDIDNQHIALKEELDEKERMCGELLADLEIFEERVKEKDSQNEELEYAVALNIEAINNLEAQLKEKQNKNKEMQQTVESLMDTINKKNLEIEDFQQQVESKMEVIKYLDQLKKDREEYCTEFEYLSRVVKENERVIQELSGQKAKLVSDNKCQEELLKDIKQQITDKKEENAKLVFKIKMQEESVKYLEQQVVAKDAEKEKTLSETENLRAHIRGLEHELKTKEVICSELLFSLQQEKPRGLELSCEMHEFSEKLTYKEKELECSKKKLTAVVDELEQGYRELEGLQKEVEALQEHSSQLETETKSLRQNLKSKNEELQNKEGVIKEFESALNQQRQHFENEIEGKLQGQQSSYDTLSSRMEAATNALEQRESQVQNLQETIRSKDSIIEKLKIRIEEKSQDIDGLLEEHESECSELHAKLDALTEELNEHKGSSTTEEMKANLAAIYRQLEEMGFSTMNDLVQGISKKCREHADMAIQIENLREEIVGKDAIIKDMTLKLNRDIASQHQQAFERKMKEKGEAELFIFHSSGTEVTANVEQSQPQSRRVSFDKTEANYGKAASKIEAMAYMLKDREAIIQKLQQEVEVKERAINALVKGLELNVQEKIESDKLAHENKTQCSEFASRVQNLSKELEERDLILEKLTGKKNGSPQRRSLASVEEIKSLSPEELLDLLTTSRILAEDLEAERERLIANATSMSVAFTESRSKVNELTQKLDYLQAMGIPPIKQPSNTLDAKSTYTHIGGRASIGTSLSSNKTADGSILSEEEMLLVKQGSLKKKKKLGIFKRV